MARLDNIEKKMSSGGPDTPRLNMEQFIKLADKEKIQSDIDNEIIQLLNEKFEEQKKPGESFSDWLKRTPREELLRIELSNGGSVEDYGDLIDAYEKGIDVLRGESLTDYIRRNRIKLMDPMGDLEKALKGKD